jgi:hypothetical protein
MRMYFVGLVAGMSPRRAHRSRQYIFVPLYDQLMLRPLRKTRQKSFNSFAREPRYLFIEEVCFLERWEHLLLCPFEVFQDGFASSFRPDCQLDREVVGTGCETLPITSDHARIGDDRLSCAFISCHLDLEGPENF